MLLDGAALTEATQAITDTELQQADPTADNNQQVDAGETAKPAGEPIFELSDSPAGQIIVIDASVPFADELLADVPPDWTVIRIGADSDGLTQLAQALQGQQDLKAIHIFTHGSNGQMQLGSLTLTTDNMGTRQADLQRLGAFLNDSGDLMLYGCDVALDFVGQSFVSQLAVFTGADVAASDDATGNLVTGGDWELEYRTGQVDATALSSANYSDTLGNINMSTGLAAGSSSISIGRYAPRLYWQASGPAGYDTGTDAKWVDQYTGDQHVNYWSSAWGSFTYSVPRWGWLPWETRTVWYQYPVVADWNYGSGTRYGVETVTLEKTSDYRFDITANALYKDKNGNILTNDGITALNTALYKGGFDPTNPLKNLVTASQNWVWAGTKSGLQLGELEAGTYQVVVSFDTNRWFIGVDNNVWWSGGNNYAQQMWGNFTLNVNNLNQAPVWTARDLTQLLSGSDTKSFSIPWSLSGNQTLVDPDGDQLTVTATLTNGSALPTWLTFNPNNLSFTGNPPANTGTLSIRLTATDGQLSSTRDFTVTYSNDNDQPVVAEVIPDQTWDGPGGAFSYTVPAGTFTDADPGTDTFTYTATLANGDPLPSWLSFNAATRTFSGNPPANFASLSVTVTANDGTGQANATQSDTFTLNLRNNNDVPTVTSIAKTISEDNTYSFSAADFVFTDTDTHATNDTTTGSGKTIQFIRIVSLPANGTLWLDADNDNVLDDGETVLVNQTITTANLAKLRYSPNKDWAGATGLDRSSSPDSFQWTASDGVNEAAAPATTSITVNLINDAPVLGFSDGRTLSVRPNTGDPLNTAVRVDAGLTLGDADAAYTSLAAYDTISKVTISITEKVTGNFISGDLLAVTSATATANGITASYNSATGVLTLSGNARADQYQAVLRTLTFSSSNTSNDNIREVSMQLQAADVGTLSYANFDGVDDYIDTMEASLPVGGDFTVSAWAQIDSTVADGAYTIVAQGNSADNFFIMLQKSGSNWQLRLGDNWAINNAFPSDGKWHQYTVTRNGTSGTLYIDGIKVATGTMEASLPGTSLRIGKLYRQSDNLEYTGHWKGGISDVRVYNRVISTDEISTSLNRDAGLKGYEPNLVAWYPLANNFNNQAADFSWSLGRDFNPLNGDGTDGPWSVGVITGSAAATGNFNWGSFQALSADNISVTTNVDTAGGVDYVMLEHKDAVAWNTTTGWSRFIFPNGFDGNATMFTPGAVTVLPGYVNPAAMQFTAPVAGVYAVDARFWDGHGAAVTSSPSYKVFKVNAAGTIGTEISPGPIQTGDNTLPNSASARSAVQQVVLAAGERLVFAIHKGDAGGLYADEVRAAIDVNLIATAVQAGGNTWYYNHATGHYIGLSTTTATWANAQTAAGAITVAGQTGYLTTATDANSINIFRALMRESGQTSVFAGGYQLANATDNATTGYRDGWFWSTGPRDGELFDGPWLTGEPNSASQDALAIHAPSGNYHLAGYDDGTASSSYRYLVEVGNSPLGTPTELATALSSNVDPGNALVFVDATTAYSAATGHYYRLANSSGDFATQQQAASGTQVQGSSGYLAQATTPDELALITRLARLNNSSGVWVGLQNVDTGNGVMDWKWVNANGTTASNLDSSQTYQTAESTLALEAAGWTRVAYDSFEHGNTGWLADSGRYAVRIEDGRLGRFSNESNQWVIKNFDLNNKATVITFDMLRLDTWDGENFIVRFRPDNFAANAIDIVLPGLRGDTNYTAPISGSQSISHNGQTATIFYTITPLANYGNLGYATAADQTFRFKIELPTNFADVTSMYFGSFLDQGYTDEAWQVDNLSFWQKNVPTNPGLGGTLETFEYGVTTGWDRGANNTSNFSNPVTVNRDGTNTTAMWIGSGEVPQKTYYIGNEATRVEFDFYALESWDWEWFYTYINDVNFNFQRVTTFNYTDVVTGSMVVNGKPVTWSITPNNDYRNWSPSPAGWNDQSFHFVIDLPENFGESFELKFHTSLDTAGTDESAAVDNIRVYSRENAGWVDPYTGVLQSSPTAPTDPNGSFVLNGQAGEYLDLGTISGLSGDYTLEAWVYADTANTWGRIFDLGNGQESNNIFLGFYGDTGRIILSNRTNGNTYSDITTTGTLPLGQWVHVAAVNNGNGTGKIYFNGVEQTITTYNNYLSPGFNVDRTNSYAGRSNWSYDDYFRGQLSQLRIWSDARTDAEINAGKAGPQGIDPTDPNLLGYWERVQLDATGMVNDLSTKNQDAWLVRIEDIVRLDQFASINITSGGRAYNDNDWNIWSLSTDGRFIYAYTAYDDGGTYRNAIQVMNMQGQVQTVIWPKDINNNSVSLGTSSMQMAYSSGWLYMRNPNATSTGTDDTIYRVSTADATTAVVSVDASHPLLAGQAWAYGSLFNMPDGRLGIVSAPDASGNATVRLYTLADNGTRMVWDRDYAINIGAGWWGDNHGATSDGRYLTLMRFVSGSEVDYKVIDLFTGEMALDGSNYNLYQQDIHNATNLTTDPLTGDIYFADHQGSHIARAARTNGATREAVVEYGTTAALTAPLLTTQANVPKPDVFVSDTRDIQVRVGNTAPSVSNWSAPAVNEDGTLSFNASQFNSRFSDPELDSLYSITLQTVPTAGQGTLSLNGTTLTANAVVFAGDLDKLVFTPAANFNGSASFSYVASDGYLSSGTATVSLTVTAVNDAPVLDTTATPIFTTIDEDVADASNTGTLVSDLVATGITDVDVGTAPQAIAVTKVDNTHGVWQYRIGAGSWTAFTATAGQMVDLGSAARLLDASDRIRFVPSANVNSTANGSPSISFRAWDKSAGTAGGTTSPDAMGGNTAVSSATDTASLTVTAVNDAPTTVAKTVTMDEDTTRTFSAADFSFTDIDGDSLASVTLQLPTAGQLLLNGVVQTSALTVAAANLGTLQYRPAADGNGAPYATIAYTVNDGTANSASATLTFNVTDTNDAPTAVKWVSTSTSSSSPVAENSAQGTVVGKLSATDPNSAAGDTVTFLRVKNPNFNIAPDGTVTVAANATLDFERTPTQTLRVQVKDSGGLTYEQDLTVTLSDVEEGAPSLIVNSVYVTKNSTTTIGAAQLNATDAQQAAGSLTYTVTAAPSGGTWWIDADGDNTLDDGEALAPVNEGNPNGRENFTQQDVINGKLRFTKDNSQSNSLLDISLSDGTAASVDADGKALVTGSLVAIVSSPPERSAFINDQQWSTTGQQSFVLPESTFTDADFDLLTLSATLSNGQALPSWLTFSPATRTFAGDPNGAMANGSSLEITVTASDGRSATTASDTFVIAFSSTATLPAVANPIPNVTFTGSGVQSYTVPANTFSDPNNDAFTYSATIPAGISSWLSFNTTTREFSGNPPPGATPGPYLITVTGTANGDSVSSTFKLFVVDANDAPTSTGTAAWDAATTNSAITTETASGVTSLVWTISGTNEFTYAIVANSTYFTDGDLDTLTLRAGDVDGNELPSWVRFDPATGTLTAKAPSGIGNITIRVFADDGKGATGFQDVVLKYSGGVNMAPTVKTPDGIYSMDGRGDLNLSGSIKAEKFSVAHQQTATITKENLQELDPDDDGAALTYTVTTLPRYGQLWLDNDGDGTINGAEVAMNTGGTFTQADIDGGKLKYRNTDTTTTLGNDPPEDSFVFNLADNETPTPAKVTGAVFNIQVTPKPASPTLLSVLRSTATTQVEVSGSPGTYKYVTNEDTVTFKLVFSENVRGLDASDFALNGDLKANAQIIGVSAINGSTYTVTVGSKTGTPGIANANGTLGLELATTPTIKNTAQTADLVPPANKQATVNNEVYTLDNTGPTATLSAQPLHDGSTAFWVTIDFGADAISDLTLTDLVVSNGTASQLQRISTNASADPNMQPVNYNPLTDPTPTPEGNRYRVLITPTSGTSNNITVELVADGVTNSAGNGNASASVTINRNSLPTVKLDAAPATPVASRSATFTEFNGADNGSAAVAFVSAGTSLADLNATQHLAWLKVSFAAPADGAAETLRVMSATSGGSIALNFANGAAISNVVLSGTSYSVTASVANGSSSLSFAKADGSLLTLAEAETLLDALRYNNSSNTPTVASREFNVSVNDGLETSSPATFTVTVAATNDNPVITVGTLDSATASLTETDTGLRASGTLSVQDLDTSQTVAISKVSVLASGTDPAANRPTNTDLLAMLAIDNGASTPGSTVVGNTSTTGTAYWVFNSGSTSFDYLAAGETLVLTYTVRATDNGSTPASGEQTITVTITGTNDKPTIATSAVTALSATSAPMTASGTVNVSDPDVSNSLTGSLAAPTITATATGGGTISLNASTITAIGSALSLTTSAPTTNPGNIAWSFSLAPGELKDSNNANLATGDKLVISYPLSVTDGTESVQKPLNFTVVMTSSTAGVLIVGGDAGSIVEGLPNTLSASDAITFDGITSFTTTPHTVLSFSGPVHVSAAQRAAIEAGFSVSPAGAGASWSFSVTESTLDFLKAGDTVTAVFRVKPDNSNTVYRDITIVISGTNDAPIITSAPAAAVGSVVEAGFGVAGTNATTPQTLTASDVDAGAVLTWSVTGQAADTSLSDYTHSKLGTYGRVYLNAQTGKWTYVLDNTATAAQALASGQSAMETFSASVSDGSASATQQIRVTVTGSNDAPVLTAPGTIATYSDSIAYDLFETPDAGGSATGSLSVSDPEDGSLTYAISGQSADTTKANFTHSVTGNYGKLYLNGLTGAYVYVPNAAKMNAATDSVTDNFTLQVTDSLGATSNTATLTVAINGVNDTPTLAPRARSGTSTFYLDETNSGLTISNTLVAGEVDSSQTLTVSIPTATVKLNSGDAQDMSATQKEWLALTPGTASGTSLPINWTFNSGNEAFNDLKPGDTLTFAYTVRVSDGALQAQSTITVVVRGTNDAPVITVSAGDAATASRTETDEALTATGTLSVSDPEAANTLTASVAGVSVHSSSTASSGAIPTQADLLAMLSLAGTVRGTNALTWTFNSGSQTFNALAAGETLVLDYTVRVTDNDNGMATQTVTVTITGTNDAPTITVVETSGAISSGFPDKLFDSGSITFTDLDISDRPTATLAVSSITGTNRSNASLTLTDNQKITIASGLSISPFGSSVTVNSFQVAEGSNAIWTIQATPHSTLLLTLGGTATATSDYGSLMVSTNGGTSWVAYGAGVNAPSNGLVMAKVAVINDGSTESAETLLLNVKPLVGDAVTGAATLVDSSASNLSVTSFNVNEGDYAVWKVQATASSILSLTLSGTASVADYSGLETSVNNGTSWQSYTAGNITAPASGPLLVRVLTTADGTQDSGETLILTATDDNSRAVQGTATIKEPASSTNTASGTVDWEYMVNQADIDFLGSGESVTAVFTVTLADGQGGSDTKPITVTLAGKNNAPVISVGAGDSDAQPLTETDTALSISDTLTVTDTNLTDSVTAQVLSATVKRNNDATVSMTADDTRLGWLTVSPSTVLSGSSRTAAADQLTWTFNSTPQAFNDLATGETLVFTYTIRVTDDAPGAMLSDEQTVTITVTGTNDAPVITLGADDGKTATLAETNAGLNVSDSLTVTDLDTANNVTVSRTLSATGNTSDPAAPSSEQLLAMLKLSANNSTWTNGPLTLIGSSATTAPLYWRFDSGSEAFNYLAAGESLVLTYTVTATDDDGTPLSDTETITVTINGSNDAPVISSSPDAQALTETNSGLSTIGSLTVGDVDTSDVVTATRTLQISGTSNRSDPAAPSDATLLAMFSVSPSTVLNATQNNATLNWSFDSGSQAFDYLAAGQTLVLTYTVTVTDDNSAPLTGVDSQAVTITITGSNDSPVISLLSQDSDGASSTETNASLSATGTLSVSDVDRANTVSPSVVQVVATGTTTGLQSNNAALLAMLSTNTSSIISNTATNGTLNWSFNSGNEHFNHLAVGEQLALTYTVRASDSSAGQTDRTIVVTVTGSNDTPTVSVTTPDDFVEASNAAAQALSASGSVDFVELDRTDLIDVSFQVAQAPAWSGGQLPAALAQSLASGFSVAANNVSVTTPVSWNYSHAATDLDFLGTNETITFSYEVIVTDASGQSSSTPVQFTVAGSNDSPVLQSVSAISLTDTVANDSFASVTGSLRSSDLDVLDHATYSINNSVSDSSRSGYDLKMAGTYGTLYLHSGTGAYEYVSDAQTINALTADASDNFTLTVTDSAGATASRVLAVNIQAANDTPTLTAGTGSTSFIDNAGDDNFVPMAGQLSGSDRDTGPSLSYSLQGAASDSTRSGYDLSKSGRFGTLYLNSSTGAYTYVPNDAAVEGQAAGSTAQDDFVFEVSDGSLTQTTGFTATIVGAGDPPVWSDGDDSVSLTESNSTLTASGSLTLTDNDLSDAVALSKAVVVSASTTLPLPDMATLLNMLSISPANLLDDDTSTSASVAWVFNSGSEYFNNLPAGETLTLTYTITASDTGTPGLTGTTTVTVTVTGTNDGPVLAAPETIALTDTADNDSLGNVTGQLNASDVDNNASLVYSLAGQVSDSSQTGYDRSQSGRFGKLYLNSSTGAYLYVPDEALIEALKADEGEAFSIRVSDGSASATQSLNIAITAGNDTPVLGAVAAIPLTDTAINNSFADVTGNLTAVDRDGDAVQFGVTGQVAATQVIGGTIYNAKKVGTYGTLYLNVDSGAYRFVVDDAATEALKTNASEVFSLQASDGSASAATLLTVNITASNDTPTLSASVTTIELTDTASQDRFASTTGVLTSSDRDAPETSVYGITGGSSDSSRGGYDLKKVGTYGTLFINSSTSAYEYVPDAAAINALSANASENFTLTLTDGSSALVSQTLSISLNAANDTPELTTNLPSTTYVDTANPDTYSAVTGALSGTDRDTGTVLTYAIEGGVSQSNTVGGVTYDRKLAGTYGTLYLLSTSGTYTYVPDDAAINSLSQNAQDVFNLVVSDGTLSQSTGFTVWLVGASDQPVISDGLDRVARIESNAAISASGSITVTDNDPADLVNLTHTVNVGGTSTGTPPSEATLLAMLSLSSASVLGDSNTTAAVTWSFNGAGSHFDYLAEGETLVLTYTIAATDTGTPALSNNTTVTITITGTNDEPVLTLPTAINLTDSPADDSLTPITGSLQSSDADHNATRVYSLTGQVVDSSRNGFDVSRTSRFGILFLNSTTGAYAFVPNGDAIEALKVDASEAFSVRVSDGTTTATQSLNVDITATNDTPTLNASVTGITFNDSGARDRFDSIAGALTSSDRDAGDSATYSIASALSDTSRAGYTHSRVGGYGTLFLNGQTGAYLYVPNDSAVNALTATTNDSFELRVTDGASATVSQTLTITLIGRNDVPVVTNSSSALVGNVIEAGHNDDGSVVAGSATASGTLSVSDADASASRSWSLQGSPSTTYGSLTIDASTGVWTYTLDNSLAATQALQEGEVVTQTYTARATDNLGAFVDQTLTITINGTNDVPMISARSSQASGTVVEAGHTDDGVASEGTSSVSRQIVASDVDGSASRVYELEGTVSSQYGRITLNRATGEWTYTLDNTLASTQSLREGQAVEERYTVRVTDERGAQVRETITVTIEGSNDVPTVIDTLKAAAYLQGEGVSVATAQLFADVDLNAGDFTFSAELPPGMLIDAQTGVISGAGTRPGDYEIVIRATDAQGARAETTWSVRINAPALLDNSGTNSGNTSSGTNNDGLTTGTSNTGTASGGNKAGPSGLDALGGGIPGFGSTIPVPSLPGMPQPGLDANAGGSGNLPAPGNTLANPGSLSSQSGNATDAGAGNATGTTAGTTTGRTTAADGVTAGASSRASESAGTGTRQAQPDSQPQTQERSEASVGADGQLQVANKTEALPQDTAKEEVSNRSVERVNVAVGANGQISLRQEVPQVNETPTGIMLVEVSQQQNGLQIEIADFRRTQVAQYRATLPSGEPLPDWIQVDPSTGKVTATPGSGVNLIELKFIAEDAGGGTRTLEIKLDLSQQSQRSQSHAEPLGIGQARSAFNQQIAMHQQQWEGYGEKILSVFTE